MKIVQKPTADLIPYARNARTHSDQQIAQLAGSIREFGFRVPVLIDGDDGIIAGHGRVLAAQKLGIEKIPCIPCGDMSENKRRAFILADNRIALNAGWDNEMLGLEMRELSELGEVDLDLIGFDEKELDEMLGGAIEPDAPEDFKEVDDETIETEHTCPKCGYEWSGGS